MKRLALLVLLVSSTASADKADALFKKGKKQLAEKRYAEACATFERVDKIDPGIGAKLNVAKCYEDWGKLARAYRWYIDAESMAKADKDKRAPKIRELIDKLDGDVPRLTIKPVGGDGEGAAITLDGDKLAAETLGKETRVDPGPHEIGYDVDGTRKTKTIAIERAGTREVALELGKPKSDKVATDDKADKPDKPDKAKADKLAKDDKAAKWRSSKSGSPPPPESEDKIVKRTEPEGPAPGRGRRIAGLAIAGAGVVGVGIASIVTLRARGDYKDALDLHCMGQTNMCSDEGLKITHDARSTANTATVISVIGAAAIVGGIVLYLTAPSTEQREDAQAMYVAPIVSPDGGGLVVGGRY